LSKYADDTYLIVGSSGGPSIYDVHTEGNGSGSGRRVWTGNEKSNPMGICPRSKLKLESTDVILSSHAKKLVSFCGRNKSWRSFVFGRNKTWKFFSDIN